MVRFRQSVENSFFSGPSIPKMLGVENEDAHTSDAGLVPVILADGKLKVET